MSFQKKWKNDSGTRTYFAWRSMRSRCLSPSNSSYKHYGGRGITVCDEWVNDFDKFVEDMGNAPEGLSLERIDNDKGYSPSNCRWASLTEQLNNQRRSRKITLEGRTQTMSQWAKEIGIGSGTLYRRLLRMNPEKALKKEIRLTWKHGTRHGYEGHKCRCFLCKEAHNKRMKKVRARRNGVDR